MQKMQVIQPEIKKLQAQYKNDRQKLNEEIMKFYKENKVNPMAGCLPLVFQMPVFFALFRVLSDPHKHVPTDSKLYRAFCGELSPGACGAAPGLPKGLSFLGMDLGQAASEAQRRLHRRPALLPAHRPRGGHRLPAVQADPVPPDGPGQPPDGDDGQDLPRHVRLHLLPDAERGRSVLPRQQRLADRPAGAHLPDDAQPGGARRHRCGAGIGFGAPPDGKEGRPKPAVEPGQPADGPQPPPEGRFKKALGQARDAGKAGGQSGGNGDGQSKPGPKPAAGRRRAAAKGRWAGPNPRVPNPGPRSAAGKSTEAEHAHGMDRYNRQDRR